jgi:hypothetical protein
MFGPIVLRVLPYVGLVVFGLVIGWQVNGWRLNTKLEALEANYARQYAAAQQKAREAEQSMQAAADKLRRDKDAQINSLNSRVRTLTAQLQSRPQRPSTSSITPDARLGLTAKGCSGAELYREDGEFLVREAARADTIRESYKQCTAQYEKARKIMATP